jgi:hypothetical protein
MDVVQGELWGFFLEHLGHHTPRHVGSGRARFSGYSAGPNATASSPGRARFLHCPADSPIEVEAREEEPADDVPQVTGI